MAHADGVPVHGAQRAEERRGKEEPESFRLGEGGMSGFRSGPDDPPPRRNYKRKERSRSLLAGSTGRIGDIVDCF